jgi:hypothetical protein
MTKMIVQEPKEGNPFVSKDGASKSDIIGISRCARNDRFLQIAISTLFPGSLEMTMFSTELFPSI